MILDTSSDDEDKSSFFLFDNLNFNWTSASARKRVHTSSFPQKANETPQHIFFSDSEDETLLRPGPQKSSLFQGLRIPKIGTPRYPQDERADFSNDDDKTDHSASPSNSMPFIETESQKSSSATENPTENEHNENLPLLDKKGNFEETSISELTFPAVGVIVLLSVTLASANVYLGLFAGITLAVSIPSAVLSLSLLRPLFPSTSLMDVNCVQTGASAGAAVAGGIVYTIPGLIILGHWDTLPYLEVAVISLVGSLLGVFFTIPLRRALIKSGDQVQDSETKDDFLKFPEGVVTAEIIKMVHVLPPNTGVWGMRGLISLGIIIGSLVKFCESGLRLWFGILQASWKTTALIFYFGVNLSPSLLAVGFIIKMRIASLILIGSLLNYYIALPLYFAETGADDSRFEGLTSNQIAFKIWNNQTRYIGVGAMLVGGAFALVGLAKPLVRGIQASVNAYKVIWVYGYHAVTRTERDIPLTYVIAGTIVLLAPTWVILYLFTDNLPTSFLLTLLLMVLAFLVSSLGAYMAGLVGSSNNPISAISILTILLTGLILLIPGFRVAGLGAPTTILVGGFACVCASVSGDSMQDLKCGAVVGSTPYKLQLSQIIGVIASSFVVAPVVRLLTDAYGLGEITEQFPNALPAPQATLAAAVADSVFSKLPWVWIGIGCGVAILFTFLDYLCFVKWARRIPILSIALGLYLPIELTFAIWVGAFLRWLAHKVAQYSKNYSKRDTKSKEHAGLLFGGGVITGEAITGIFVAIPIVVTGNQQCMALIKDNNQAWPGAIVWICAILAFFFVTTRMALFQMDVSAVLQQLRDSFKKFSATPPVPKSENFREFD